MPRGDGTGPAGKGPRTGRGAGSCPPSKRFVPIGFGRGFGLGLQRRFRGGR